MQYEWWVRQFKESVRQFAQENIAPHAAAIDANNTFPQVADLTPPHTKIKIWTQEESLNNVCLFIILTTDSGHHIFWKCFAHDIKGRIA